LSENIRLTILPSYHDDVLTSKYCVGLGFELIVDDNTSRRIAFTGDTPLFPLTDVPPADALPPISVDQAYPDDFSTDKIDLLIAHIGTITEADLAGPLGVVEKASQTFTPTKSVESGGRTPRATKQEQHEEGRNHLRLVGTFAVIFGLKPKAAIVSEFGEEMKSIWIKAVRALEAQLTEVVTTKIPVFAGDPVLIYDIINHQFLCHEDQQFHPPEDLRMVGIHEVRTGSPPGPTRPYLFRSSPQFQDESDYEDKVREFHDNLDGHRLPHMKDQSQRKVGTDISTSE
jgi:hypothetical protein